MPYTSSTPAMIVIVFNEIVQLTANKLFREYHNCTTGGSYIEGCTGYFCDAWLADFTKFHEIWI